MDWIHTLATSLRGVSLSVTGSPHLTGWQDMGMAGSLLPVWCLVHSKSSVIKCNYHFRLVAPGQPAWVLSEGHGTRMLAVGGRDSWTRPHPGSLAHVHSLKLLQLAHQLRLLLRSHAGKYSALDQDLGAQ